MTQLPNPGDVITKIKITGIYGKRYSPYALSYLKSIGALIPIPRLRRGEKQKYQVQKLFPTSAAMVDILNKKFTSKIEWLINDAFDVFEELGEELREWRDNMPETLQEGEKASILEESASALESLVRPDIPEDLFDFEAVFYPYIDTSSRQKRCDEARHKLTAVISILEDIGEDLTGYDIGSDVDQEQLQEAARALADELENARLEAENVEFPGLYG